MCLSRSYNPPDVDTLMVLPLGELKTRRAMPGGRARASIPSHGARLEVMRERTPRSEPFCDRWVFIGLEDSGDMAILQVSASAMRASRTS